MENKITVPTEETLNKDLSEKKNDTVKANTKKVPFAVVEAYKTIRTNLFFSLPKDGCKTFVISSPSPSEGKSTTALNVAIAFSQFGKNVLLIDGDLRRPSLHKKAKLLNTKGLYNALVGTASIEECIQSVNRNFDILTSGPLPPNPPEMLGSEAFDNLLTTLKERYEYIIFDSPPVNVVSDAITLAPKTDGLLMVVRDGFTNRDDLKHAIDACEFANIRILGVVLNDIDTKRASKYSYKKRYYAKYNYRYRYSYSRSSTSNNQVDSAKK